MDRHGAHDRERAEPRVLRVAPFADVHVHFREPGFEYKETIATGVAAAAAGGYTDVCCMPNLRPVPDSQDAIRPLLDAISRAASPRVRVHAFGAITRGERGEKLADIEGLAPLVCGFSDDGRGVQDRALMRDALDACAALGKTVAAHCEDESEEKDSPRSEWRMIERDLELVRDVGARYHVCHVSTRESLSLIRDAKADGLRVSCETAPHYLLLCGADALDHGRFKMNPPLRAAADRDALVEGLRDGIIDCVATDHAPHSGAEKDVPFAKALNGVVGLECAFAVLYTHLVEPGFVPLERLLDAMSVRPRVIFSLPRRENEFTEVELGVDETVDASRFRSLGRSTPFDGMRVHACIVN